MPDWKTYLQNTKERFGSSSEDNESDDPRSVFQKDFDRIVFSSAFRRLQNKTQVLPLPKSDSVRNRLTHSLETASVGRSLGILVGHHIFSKDRTFAKEVDLTPNDIGYMVSSACLAHDIGNPPFGHAGEKAISYYYNSSEGKKLIGEFNDLQKADLQHFEGNASGFRLLTTGIPKLTYGTLATFLKYPKESLPFDKDAKDIHKKKYGFFHSEINTISEVTEAVGMLKGVGERRSWKRFPLAYLVESADDICYRILDYEDGYNLGIISFMEIETHFLNITGEEERFKPDYYNKINSEQDKIAYLRSLVINQLVFNCVEVFKDNESGIMNGKLETPLTKRLSYNTLNILSDIKPIS